MYSVDCESKSLREALETATDTDSLRFWAKREVLYIVWWHSFPNVSTQIFDNISKVPDMYTVGFTF